MLKTCLLSSLCPWNVRSSYFDFIAITLLRQNQFTIDEATSCTLSMLTPKDVVRALGAGGLHLLPFYKSVCVYFLVVGGVPGGAPSPAAPAVPPLAALAAKCAPVLCLLLAVLLRRRTLPPQQARYAALVGWGLALSALGDACLACPGGGALAGGMLAFGAAHACYTAAFGWAVRRARLGAACACGAALYVRAAWGAARGALRALLPLYAALLALMAWRGAARGGPAAWGAALFLLSDALLGYELLGGPLPYRQLLVMATYYVGQLGIALSALQSPAAPAPPPQVPPPPPPRASPPPPQHAPPPPPTDASQKSSLAVTS